MTVVVGELNFNRNSGSSQFWEAQVAPGLPHRSLSNLQVQADGPLVLGWRGYPGMASPGLGEPYSAGDLTVAATGRLDNREELGAALGLPASERRGWTDNRLVLTAFAAWGKDCFRRLIGDWSLFLWDRGRRRLFLARDASGQQGLYYFLGRDHSLVFATCLNDLLAFPQVPQKPDLSTVARLLLVWPDVTPGQTYYEKVYSLPAGHYLRAGPQGTELRTYWRWGQSPLLRLKHDEEYLEAFHQVFTQAVGCRLEGAGPHGATLSGGLDSGAVAVTAAEILAKQGQHLTTFSSIPLYEVNTLTPSRRTGDEKPFIEAIRKKSGGIDAVYCQAETVSPLQGLTRFLALTGEPVHAAANLYWIIALMDAARSRGIRTLLTGQKGNFTISWECNNFLFYLVRRGRMAQALRELQAQKMLTRPRGWLKAAAMLMTPLIPYSAGQLMLRRLKGQTPWYHYSYIHPQMFQRLDLERQFARTGHDPYFLLGPLNPQIRLKLLSFWANNSVPPNVEAKFGLAVSDPTADRRVTEFCLSIPEDQYFRNGEARWLIRRSMSGRLPQLVLDNRKRGLQAADLAHRMQASLPELTEALSSLQKSHLAREMLDLARLRDDLVAVQRMQVAAIKKIDLNAWLKGVMIGLFLQRFS